MLIFLNGQFVPEARALVPANDRGFLLGDGLFETMRVANGKPFRFAQHLERLARGADFLKIKLPFAPEQMENFARRLVEKNKMPDAILRLTLTRGAGERGYAFRGKSKPTIFMALHPAPKNSMKWNLVTSSFRILAGDPLSQFKTTSKILHVMARAEANERGTDEALILNHRGEIAETVSGNLFWVQGEKIFTPPTNCGALPGITRAVVLEICKSLGLRTGEKNVKPEALKNSKGIFITQSALGIVPVKNLDGKIVAPSPLVEKIARAYELLLKE